MSDVFSSSRNSESTNYSWKRVGGASVEKKVGNKIARLGCIESKPAIFAVPKSITVCE